MAAAVKVVAVPEHMLVVGVLIFMVGVNDWPTLTTTVSFEVQVPPLDTVKI